MPASPSSPPGSGSHTGPVLALVDTPHGPARTHRHPVDTPVGTLLLGHGAGGGVDAGDLRAVCTAGAALGLVVVSVEQPYRVAGRRAPAPAVQLDAAWLAVVGALGPTGPLIVGGRSSGARVACRTATAAGACAVLCLAFPLVPPRAARPTSRQGELDAVRVPVLVVQGARDPYGRPAPAPGREVVVVPGNHAPADDPRPVARAVTGWLTGVLGHA